MNMPAKLLSLIYVLALFSGVYMGSATADGGKFKPYFFANKNRNSMFACNKLSKGERSAQYTSLLPPRCRQKSYVGSFFSAKDTVINVTSEKRQTREYLKAYHQALKDGFTVEQMEQMNAPHVTLLDDRSSPEAMDGPNNDNQGLHDLGCDILTSSLAHLFPNSDKNDVKVLDVGCGIGGFAVCLLKKFPTIRKVVGISLSPSELTVAKQLVKDTKELSDDQKLKIEFKFMDMNKLNKHFKPNSFDLIFNRESFIYAKDPYEYLKHVYNILKPNGHIRMIAGMLRRDKLTYWESQSLTEDYMDKTMMGKENPCCILSIQHLRSDLEDIGYHRVMIHDLAPYMRPVLEGVLENFFKQKQKKDDDGQAGKKVSFFVKLARAMLDGYESLFFVNGEKLIVKQRPARARIGKRNYFLRQGD